MCNVVPPSINNKKKACFILPFNSLGNMDGGHRDFDNIVHILSTTPSMNSLGALHILALLALTLL